MDLKKQMEMDLEELKKELQEIDYRISNNNSSKLNELDLVYSKLIGKIDLINKYLKCFENDMPIEAGKRYKVKADKYQEVTGNENFCSHLHGGDIRRIDDIYDSAIISLYDDFDNQWDMDIETFKHMFEECENG